MQKKSINSISGFSLLELMVVLSVIAVIVSISVPLYKNMIIKARVMQGLTNGRVLYTQMRSYTENDDSWTVPFGGMMLSNNNFETATSCNTDNVFGFTLTNCKKVYHFYSFAKASVFAFAGWEGKGMGQTAEPATSRISGKQKTAGPSYINEITCGDIWVINEIVSHHFVNRAMPDLSKCKGWISSVVEAFMSTKKDLRNDWNLDGQVNTSDFSSTFGIFPPFDESGLPPYYH